MQLIVMTAHILSPNTENTEHQCSNTVNTEHQCDNIVNTEHQCDINVVKNYLKITRTRKSHLCEQIPSGINLKLSRLFVVLMQR